MRCQTFEAEETGAWQVRAWQVTGHAPWQTGQGLERGRLLHSVGQHAQLEALAAGLLESQEETGCWHPHHCFQLKKKLPISTVEDRPRPLPAVLLATTMPASHSARLGRLAAHLRVHEAPKRVRPQRCGGMIGPHVVILGAATADAGERPTAPPKEGCFKNPVCSQNVPPCSPRPSPPSSPKGARGAELGRWR